MQYLPQTSPSRGRRLVRLDLSEAQANADDTAFGHLVRDQSDLAERQWGGPHHVSPAVLSLSQATEAGTIYRPHEIRRLAEVAHARGLTVHMDGARLGNALVRMNASPAEATWKAGVDVLSFGATKGGVLAAEAVLFFDPARSAAMASAIRSTDPSDVHSGGIA